MSDTKSRLAADQPLYDAVDHAMRTLRADLLRRAERSGDYRMVIGFGERLLRYGSGNIAWVAGCPAAAEHAYRAADDLVARSMEAVRGRRAAARRWLVLADAVWGPRLSGIRAHDSLSSGRRWQPIAVASNGPASMRRNNRRQHGAWRRMLPTQGRTAWLE